MVIELFPWKSDWIKKMKGIAQRYKSAEQRIKKAGQDLWEAKKDLKKAIQDREVAEQMLARAVAAKEATIKWCDVGKEMREFFEKNKSASPDDPQMQELIKKEIVAYREYAAYYPNPKADEEYLSYWLSQLKTQEALH